MKVLSVHEEKIEWTDVDREVATAPDRVKRAPGIHLSGILRELQIEAGLLQVKENGKWVGDTEDDDEVFPLRMAMGMAWEAWIAARYHDMYWQPGGFEVDGIHGSPDGLTPHDSFDESLNIGNTVVEEFKLTWLSYRERIQDVTKWIWQGMGYCKMVGTVYCRFNILYVNGDYRIRPYAPKYMRYLCEFSQAEIDRYWKMVVKNKHKATPEG
ncbi:MAG TPA: hypothetical protein VF077_03965 [Nitrospiraceae bacterium]